jgi:probable rRNA maturation factor
MSLQHLDIDVALEHEAWHSDLPDLEDFAQHLCHRTLEFTGFLKPTVEISFVFTDDASIQTLNAQYRSKDKPTNVLSFPQYAPENLSKDEDFLMLGDIVLAYETVKSESAEQAKSFRHHTAHMIVHGLLHLLGHDHIEDRQAEIMEALERKILKSFNIPDPYDALQENAGFMRA